MNVVLDRKTDIKKFENERIALSLLRDGISAIYHDMGGFIVKTTEQMDMFSSMIMPYVRYFYPAGDSATSDCFITEVVNPSRRELDSAIDAAVNIMAGDEKMNERVSMAIEDVLELGGSVDLILDLIDEIDIYAENMLIISSKYGTAGMSLARISSEVGAMARMVNGIGEKFRDFMRNLVEYRKEFSEIRRRIEVISENYLTRMKLNLSIVFGEMVRELGIVSENVNDMLGGSAEVEKAMKVFVANIQMEDIIRQKIERIIMLLDDSWEDACHGDPGILEEVGTAAVHVAAANLSDLWQDLAGQSIVVEGFSSKITSILHHLIERFYGGEGITAEKKEDRMDLIYRKIEGLKDEYIRHMEEIVSGKKCLLGLCESFIIILNEFEGLFGGIAGTVKKFEAMNMITRIELARNAKFTRSLSGSLTSVMTLPVQMKRIVDGALAQYGGIRKNIVSAVEQYAENFNRQEEVLGECIGSMKKVSVKLYESQKYYWDISQEIGRSSSKILGFIEGEGGKSGMATAIESLSSIRESMDVYLKATTGGSKPDLEALWRRVRETPGLVTYKPLLDALSGELAGAKTKEQVIIF